VCACWSLDRRERKRSGAVVDTKLRACLNCTGVYERVLKVCPYCGHEHVPPVRTGPEFVDGDLTELDEATLARMRGAIAVVDLPLETYRADLAARHMPVIGQMANVKRHARRQEAQAALRERIALWAGHGRAAILLDDQSQAVFVGKNFGSGFG
jgi:hypothetical protein